MQDARVLGVHACVSSTTILARTAWMNLWEDEKGYIYIYYFQFTVYILRSCSLSIPIDQAAYLVQDSIWMQWTVVNEGNFISGAPIK